MPLNKITYLLLAGLFILILNLSFAQKIQHLEGIKEGKIAPDIEFPIIDGDIIKLSEYTKGNI